MRHDRGCRCGGCWLCQTPDVVLARQINNQAQSCKLLVNCSLPRALCGWLGAAPAADSLVGDGQGALEE